MIEAVGDWGEFSARVTPAGDRAAFPTLPLGDYTIRIAADGFEVWRTGFTVAPARGLVLRVKLVPDEKLYRKAVSPAD